MATRSDPVLPVATAEVTTVRELLDARAALWPGAVALLAPDRAPATSVDLHRQVAATTERLRAAGVGPGDRVAITLPNGADLAVALLAAAGHAVAAPLAPDQPRAALEQQLAHLGARILVAPSDAPTPARSAAVALGVPVVELEPHDRAGDFSLRLPPTADPPAIAPEPLDAALLLSTSGTTSTPKQVPLTERNLLLSAANVAAVLRLGPDDRGLNLMPLFHIHGLVAGLLAPLLSGGSVVCTPGFRAADVPRWIEELRPSWYSAVPTLHQAMVELARARDSAGVALPKTFRVVRSSSSALAPRLLAELEEVFGAPVLEAYGMTECAHQICSNPLPPATRKPGTVGLPAGPEVAVLDERGRPLGAGEIGEIALRGPMVTAGYLDNADANATAFTADGWFRTGDQGCFDGDGYVRLTGRLKELINRGGEKVAPREIDEALLAHPDVVHAVAFAVPHPRLGEEPAAAVVLRDGARTTSAELRVFAAERLTPYKVPRRVVVVDELPKGPSGKLQRTNLAAQLGLTGGTAHRGAAPGAAPTDDTERRLAAVWQRILGLDEPPAVDADFFDVGGDSLHAIELLAEIERDFGQVLPATLLLTGATVRDMAGALRGGRVDAKGGGPGPSVIAVQPAGAAPPLFCLLRGAAIVTLRQLAAGLGPDQPVYALWYPAMHGSRSQAGSVEEIAAGCAAAVRAARPDGPYALLGHSLGGLVAYEAARQLAASGAAVTLVALLDVANPTTPLANTATPVEQPTRTRLLFSRRGPGLVAGRLRRALGLGPPAPAVERIPGTDIPIDWAAAVRRERAYVPGPAAFPVTVLVTARTRARGASADLGWAGLTDRWCEVIDVPGDHDTMLSEPHVHVLARRLVDVVGRAASGRTA